LTIGTNRFFFAHTGHTDTSATFLAGRKTLTADPVTANGTLFQTGNAGGGIAATAVARTALAKFIAAVLTGVGLVFRYLAAALVTRSADPVLQRDIRGIRVVRVKDIDYEREKVVDAAFVQGHIDGRGTVPFTKPLATDVRVRHIFVRRGRVRFAGDHTVTQIARMLPEIRDLDLNLKGTQIRAFEFYRRSLDGKAIGLYVDGEFIELLLDLTEFVIDGPHIR